MLIVTFAVSIIGTIGADPPPGPYRVLHFYRPIPNTLRVDFVLAVLYDDPSLLEVHTGTCVQCMHACTCSDVVSALVLVSVDYCIIHIIVLVVTYPPVEIMSITIDLMKYKFPSGVVMLF